MTGFFNNGQTDKHTDMLIYTITIYFTGLEYSSRRCKRLAKLIDNDPLQGYIKFSNYIYIYTWALNILKHASNLPYSNAEIAHKLDALLNLQT